jgi:hypothetical protein
MRREREKRKCYGYIIILKVPTDIIILKVVIIAAADFMKMGLSVL